MDVNTRSIQDLKTRIGSFEICSQQTLQSLDFINSKLTALKSHDQWVVKTLDFEFGLLQEGINVDAKASDKESIKLFFKLGRKTEFL